MSIVKRKQISIELANDSYKLSLNNLYGFPLKENISLLSIFNQYMILDILDQDTDEQILSPEERKCLIARLGLTNDWKKYTLTPICELPTVTTSRLQRPTQYNEYQTNVVCETLTDGGCDITERGVCVATTSLPTVSDTVLKDSIGGLGVYSLNVPLLSTTTYFRSYAKNSKGIAYGNILSLTITVET